jgi:catechol 2,3-dioxygenase-like lactoylglutathione lyase family enzyme
MAPARRESNLLESRVRFLAIVTEHPAGLSHFYQEYFGLKELATSPGGDVSLTEGSFNLTLLKRRDEQRQVGISHLGVAVDDMREVQARLEEFAPDASVAPLDGSPAQGDYRVFDPNGYAVHVSTSAFGMGTDSTGLPGVRHVALCEPHGDAVADFFTRVFGFAESRHSLQERQQGTPDRFATDGRISLALLADTQTMHDRGLENISRDHMKLGVDHFGFGVESYEPILNRLPAEAEARPARRPGRPEPNEWRLLDPDGNHIDLRLGQVWAPDRSASPGAS